MQQLFANPRDSAVRAGDGLAVRLNGLSGRDSDRTSTEIEDVNVDNVGSYAYDEKYVCFHHSLRAADVLFDSYLLMPHRICDTVADEYSLWPGDEKSVDFEKEAKIEAVGHNAANSAIDIYAEQSDVTEFEVSPPDIEMYDGSNDPFAGLVEDKDELVALVNECQADDHPFRHVLLVPAAALSEV